MKLLHFSKPAACPRRALWIQIAAGHITVNNQPLNPGDGAAVSEESTVVLTANTPAQAVVFDLQ